MSDKIMSKKVTKKYLISPKKIRKFVNSMINDIRENDNPNIPKYRAMGYLCKILLDCYQIEEFDARLKTLEEKLGGACS